MIATEHPLPCRNAHKSQAESDNCVISASQRTNVVQRYFTDQRDLTRIRHTVHDYDVTCPFCNRATS